MFNSVINYKALFDRQVYPLGEMNVFNKMYGDICIFQILKYFVNKSTVWPEGGAKVYTVQKDRATLYAYVDLPIGF